ncbi:hypothetical protein VTG60DRAFT_7186 [Thermothelomyces hinnuleus]
MCHGLANLAERIASPQPKERAERGRVQSRIVGSESLKSDRDELRMHGMPGAYVSVGREKGFSGLGNYLLS